MQTSPLGPRRAYLLVLGLILALACGVTSPVWASVTLTRFEAIPQTDTIKVEWQTASEIGTQGFRLYRAEQENPANWGAAVYSVAPRGDSITGATYTYVDGADGNVGNVQPGVRYYYLLEELSGTGGSRHGPVNAGIGMQTMPSATATATATATITPIVVGTATRTRTPVPTGAPTNAPAPTATRQFPNTATPVPTATFDAGSAFDSSLATPFLAPTLSPTPIGPASVTSPTPVGGIPLARADTSLQPPDGTPTAALIALEVTATPTSLTAQLDPTASPTLILPAQDRSARTPEVFEPSSTSRRATPEAITETRNTGVSYALGGGAIVLAVLLGVGGFAVWQSRRH